MTTYINPQDQIWWKEITWRRNDSTFEVKFNTKYENGQLVKCKNCVCLYDKYRHYCGLKDDHWNEHIWLRGYDANQINNEKMMMVGVVFMSNELKNAIKTDFFHIFYKDYHSFFAIRRRYNEKN